MAMKGSLSSVDGTISGALSAEEGSLSGLLTVGGIQGDFDQYEGEYEITPKAREDTYLMTRNKLLLNNITIEKIPVYTVSNDTGGLTFTIGG